MQSRQLIAASTAATVAKARDEFDSKGMSADRLTLEFSAAEVGHVVRLSVFAACTSSARERECVARGLPLPSALNTHLIKVAASLQSQKNSRTDKKSKKFPYANCASLPSESSANVATPPIGWKRVESGSEKPAARRA